MTLYVLPLIFRTGVRETSVRRVASVALRWILPLKPLALGPPVGVVAMPINTIPPVV